MIQKKAIHRRAALSGNYVQPDLSYDEAESILIDAKAKNSYVGYEYRDVKITYEYDKSYSAQSWFISPK